MGSPESFREEEMPGPLAGYLIIDVTQIVSGPMAPMLLADQAADVIKISRLVLETTFAP
jgi:crotonobetainyl-CoA:carnitine CoA-transferase CaiB-like acyl-CoA transferase